MSVIAARSTTFALCLGACLFGACGAKTPPPPHGSPILTHVYWVAGGTGSLVWARVDDPKLQPAVPPFATEVDFVFDRRIDGDRIEDTVTDGGVTTTRPKAMPPITASWPGSDAAAATDPPFKLQVAYNSAGRFGEDSSYVFARPVLPGFPSSETVTFALDLPNLASAYGEPADAPTTIPVKTSAFTVAIGVPTVVVTTSFQVPLVFSNRLPRVAGGHPAIHVTTNGAAVSTKVLADASDSSRWYLAPADCLGAWPAGATLTIAIDATLADAFGRTLAQGATATFKTGPGAAAPPNASCPVADGGATDGGVSGDGGTGAADALEDGTGDLAEASPNGSDAARDAGSDGG